MRQEKGYQGQHAAPPVPPPPVPPPPRDPYYGYYDGRYGFRVGYLVHLDLLTFPCSRIVCYSTNNNEISYEFNYRICCKKSVEKKVVTN